MQRILRLANESGPGMLRPQGPEQPFAFKDLMIHLILQFTLHIAFRGVLHRCANQEIHRWKVDFGFLFCLFTNHRRDLGHNSFLWVLKAPAQKVETRLVSFELCMILILPQVHLRKPCYCFSFAPASALRLETKLNRRQKNGLHSTSAVIIISLSGASN